MAGTVTSDMAFFTGSVVDSSCDAYNVADWSGVPALWTDYFIQGTGALGLKLGTTGIYFLFTIAAASIDLTGKIVMVWCSDPESKKLLDATGAYSALRIVLQDTSGRNAEWWMADTNSWYGEWKPFIAHADTVPGVTSGVLGTTVAGFDKTLVKKIGTYWKHNALGKNTPNMYFDGLRYGTGLTITGGTSGDPATLTNLVTAENLVANQYGIISEENGILTCQGKLTIGSLSAATPTYFKDTSKVIVFPNRYVPDNFYEVIAQGNASTPSNTTIFLGDPVTKVSGLALRTAPGAKKFKFTATDVNVTRLGLRGCNFFEAATVALPPTYPTGTGVAWARSGTTVTITKVAHGLITGNTIIVSVSSDVTALPLATYDATKLTADTFTVVGIDAGGAAGTCSYYTLDREVINTNLEACTTILPDTGIITNSNFISYGAISLGTSAITGCSFIGGTGLLTLGGGLFTGCKVISSTAAVAAFWNVAVDTNGKLDGTAFTSAGTGHAIELGPNCPAAITFKNMAFNSYGADTTTDAAIYNNSGKAIAISLIGTTQPTVRNGSGASTTFPSSITLKIAVKDVNGDPMVGVRCYIDDQNVSPFILDDVTDVNGEASVVHTAGPAAGATWRVRKYGYHFFQQLVSIGSVDITLPVTLTADPLQV